MDREWLYISERMGEVSRICGREHPIYEHASNFSIALYILGFLKCPDIMSAEDVEEVEAGEILKEHFVPVKYEEIPSNYNILKSKDKYLLAIGDPLFPTHFAVVTDMHSLQPFFSKIKVYGCGFDSLAELKTEFLGWEGVEQEDFLFYKMKQPKSLKKEVTTKIYIMKSDEEYSVTEYDKRIIEKKEEALCR